jgi:FixJ family two-component response regulator
MTIPDTAHLDRSRPDGPVSPAVRPNIMLVESDAAVRRSLQLVLQARGYGVKAHASGQTLLDDPVIATAACLITEYQLDGLDGFEILSRLRARGWTAPALLITAYPTQSVVERAAIEGFGAVIEKPFREAAVAAAIRRLVSQS